MGCNLKEKHVLNIRLTSECNLECGFCKHKMEGARGDDLDTVDFTSRLAEVLSKTKYANIALMGGEPLCDKQKLDAVARTAKEWAPDAGFYLATNGTYLDRPVVDWLNANGISATLSLQSLEGPEKSLADIIYDTPGGVFSR